MIRLVAVLLALLAAVRAPHHDDTLAVSFPFGTFQAVRGFAVLDSGGVGFDGEPCDHLHLAAHRTTHGAPFAAVPTLRVGDTIDVWASVACTYRVDDVHTQLGNVQPPFGDLLVQTSWPGGFVIVLGHRV